MTVNSIEEVFEHPWSEDLLLNLGSVTVGGTPRTSVEKYWKDEIPWMSSGDVHLRRIYDVPGRISKLGLQSSNATLVSPPSVAVGLAGQGKTRGTVALVLENICTNQSVALIKSEEDKLNIVYLFYNLEFRYQELRSRSAGGGRAGLSKGILEQLSIPLPQVDEQEKISTVLSTIDRAIEQTEAIIAKQQRIKTGLMQDLLTKGIDENGNIRSEETHEFKDSAIGRIPVEWSIEPIGKIASLQRGHDIREADLIPGVYPVVASSGVIGFHNRGTSSSPNVVGRKGSIGNVHYVDTDFWAHDTSLYVTNFFGNNEKYIYYLFSYLKLERFGTKSGSPSLNRNDVHPLKVPFPDTVEQGRISSMLSEFDTSMKSIKCTLSKLQRKKIGLMQDLLTGKVRVTPLLDAHPLNASL